MVLIPAVISAPFFVLTADEPAELGAELLFLQESNLLLVTSARPHSLLGCLTAWGLVMLELIQSCVLSSPFDFVRIFLEHPKVSFGPLLMG